MRQLVVTTLVAGDLWLPGGGFVDPLAVDGGWWTLAGQAAQVPVDPDLPDDRRLRLPRLERVLGELRADPSVPDEIVFMVLLARHDPPRITDTAALHPVLQRWAEVYGVGLDVVVSPPDPASDLAAIRGALAHLGTLTDPASVALAVPADSELVHLVHAMEVLDALPHLGRVEIAETPAGESEPPTARRAVPTMLARRVLARLLRDRIDAYELIAARRIASEVDDLLTAEGRELLDAAARYCQRNAGPLQDLGGWVLDDRPAGPGRPAGPDRHLHDTRRVIHALDLSERLWLLGRDEEDVAWFLCVALIELLPSAWLESLAVELDLGWPQGMPGRALSRWLTEPEAGPPIRALMEVGDRTLALLGWRVMEQDHLGRARLPLAALAPSLLRTRRGGVLAVTDTPLRASLRARPELQAQVERTALVWLAFGWELRLLRNHLAHDLLDLDRDVLRARLNDVVAAASAEVERLRPDAGWNAHGTGSPDELIAAVVADRLRLSDEEVDQLAGQQGSLGRIAAQVARVRGGGGLTRQDRQGIRDRAGSPDPLDLRRAQLLAELVGQLDDDTARQARDKLAAALRARPPAPWSPPAVFDDVAALVGEPELLVPRAPYDPADPGGPAGPRRLLGACLPEVLTRPNALRVCRSLLLADLDR